MLSQYTPIIISLIIALILLFFFTNDFFSILKILFVHKINSAKIYFYLSVMLAFISIFLISSNNYDPFLILSFLTIILLNIYALFNTKKSDHFLVLKPRLIYNLIVIYILFYNVLHLPNVSIGYSSLLVFWYYFSGIICFSIIFNLDYYVCSYGLLITTTNIIIYKFISSVLILIYNLIIYYKFINIDINVYFKITFFYLFLYLPISNIKLFPIKKNTKLIKYILILNYIFLLILLIKEG